MEVVQRAHIKNMSITMMKNIVFFVEHLLTDRVQIARSKNINTGQAEISVSIAVLRLLVHVRIAHMENMRNSDTSKYIEQHVKGNRLRRAESQKSYA